LAMDRAGRNERGLANRKSGIALCEAAIAARR
jgi:hypothetical protein